MAEEKKMTDEQFQLIKKELFNSLEPSIFALQYCLSMMQKNSFDTGLGWRYTNDSWKYYDEACDRIVKNCLSSVRVKEKNNGTGNR